MIPSTSPWGTALMRSPGPSRPSTDATGYAGEPCTARISDPPGSGGVPGIRREIIAPPSSRSDGHRFSPAVLPRTRSGARRGNLGFCPCLQGQPSLSCASSGRRACRTCPLAPPRSSRGRAWGRHVMRRRHEKRPPEEAAALTTCSLGTYNEVRCLCEPRPRLGGMNDCNRSSLCRQ